MITIDSSGFADAVMDTNGQLVYYNSGRTALDVGNTGDILEVASGLPAWIANHPTVAVMPGVDFDFDSTDAVQTISIAATTTFTGSNYAAGKSITLFITTDGSTRTLNFPAGWVFQGTKPTEQAASKVGTLTLLCSSTTEASVRCAYAVEE